MKKVSRVLPLVLLVLLLMAGCKVVPATAQLPCDGSGVLLSLEATNPQSLGDIRKQGPVPEYQYQWYRDAQPISGATGETYLATVAGVYSATVTIAEGAGSAAIDSLSTEPSLVLPCHPDPRADIAVVIYGGWDAIPVRAWVGGTEQEMLYTAQDAFGEAAVLWTFYPPEGETWNVQVAPQTPAGMDSTRWQYKLLRITSICQDSEIDNPASATVSIQRGSGYVFYFQLIDTQAATP